MMTRSGQTMRISDLLREELVLDDLTASDKDGVLAEFAGRLQQGSVGAGAREIARVLTEREALGSTGIGDGVAVPHAKLRGLGQTLMAFGRSRNGVDFQSRDGKPVHLFFVLVTPEDHPGEHLKALARISRVLKNPVLRENLRRAPHARDLYRMIVEEDQNYPQR